MFSDGLNRLFSQKINKRKQIDFKSKAKSFVRVYGYLSKILTFNNIHWEKLFHYLKFLLPKLHIDKEDDFSEEILQSIDLDSYRPDKKATQDIYLPDSTGEVAPIPVEAGGKTREVELDTLENIIKVFNEHFGDITWTDSDKAIKFLTVELPQNMRENAEFMKNIAASDRQNAKIVSDKQVEILMQQHLFNQTEVYKKFSEVDFQRRYKEFIFELLLRNNLPHSQRTPSL